MFEREELERAQTSLHKKIISRDKNHFQKKPRPKIVATLYFILGAEAVIPFHVVA